MILEIHFGENSSYSGDWQVCILKFEIEYSNLKLIIQYY